MYRFLVMAIVVIFLLGRSAVFADQSEQALEDYSTQVRAILQSKADGDAINRFNGQWLAHFLQLANTEPNSPYHELVLAKAESLANGTGQMGLSRQIAQQILAMQTTWEGKLRWNEELGEICQSSSAGRC